MLAFWVQHLDTPWHAEHANLLAPVLMIVGGAVVGLALIPLVRITRRRLLLLLRGWRARRRNRRSHAMAEIRARAMMSELCPYGWSAQITLFDGARGADEEPPPDVVALDWIELGEDRSRPKVLRRVWAPTIAQALGAMVLDRQTDAALEQIELQATADGADWLDL